MFPHEKRTGLSLLRGLPGGRYARQLVRRAVGRAVILLYHRVAELPSDPQLLGVTRPHFAEHLEILRKQYSPMRLRQLNQALQEGSFPHRAAIVTFDDGYADNLYNAKPLLDRYDLPATVFIATGYLGQPREFWWDELDRILLQPGTLPQTLCLNFNNHPYRWELGDVARYEEPAYRCHRGWNVLEEDRHARHRLYRALHRLLRPLSEERQRAVLDELRAWAGAAPTGRSTHQVLSPDGVLQLTEGGLVEVGAHTVTHPVLSALPAVLQRIEIQKSRACLEEILGRPVTSFAYPYGSSLDYTAETVALVREAGFALACSNFAGVIWRRSDRFQLPRVLIRDWDGDEFDRQLRAFFGG